MTDTLSAARDQLFDLYTSSADGAPNPALAAVNVGRVYDHEPLEYSSRLAVTVSAVALTPSDFEVRVRAYRQVVSADGDVGLGHDEVIAATDALDALNKTTSYQNPSRWDIGFDLDTGAYVSETTLSIPRDVL